MLNQFTLSVCICIALILVSSCSKRSWHQVQPGTLVNREVDTLVRTRITVSKFKDQPVKVIQQQYSLKGEKLFDFRRLEYANGDIQIGKTSGPGHQTDPYIYRYDKEGRLIGKSYHNRIKADTASRTFYPDGTLRSEWYSIFGYGKHGEHRHFYLTGELQVIEVYQRDLVSSVQLFDKNGNALPVGTFKGGQGLVNVYDSTGQVTQRRVYENGRFVRCE